MVVVVVLLMVVEVACGGSLYGGGYGTLLRVLRPRCSVYFGHLFLQIKTWRD